MPGDGGVTAGGWPVGGGAAGGVPGFGDGSVGDGEPIAGTFGLALSRGIVSEPVYSPRRFAAVMSGIRTMCGVSIMMISVESRVFTSCEKKYLSIGIFLSPGSPLSDDASVSVIIPPKTFVSPSANRISCCTCRFVSTGWVTPPTFLSPARART